MDEPTAQPATIHLDLLSLMTNASWPVRITTGLLVAATAGVWIITVLKYIQLARLKSLAQDFERRARNANSGADLYQIANDKRSSPGARVLHALFIRGSAASVERLRAVADRAIVSERQNARAMMAMLGSIAAAAPFIGLFGTVYGIMDAFVRIGAAKSASLPVVAPAIGEALITTAIGLAAAIPAVIFFNSIDKRVGDFIAELEAAAGEWVTLIAEGGEPIPLVPGSNRPRAR